MRLALLLASLTTLGCREAKRETSSAPTSPVHPLFSGCTSVREGPICALREPASLTVWIAGDALLEASWVAGTRRPAVERARVRGGDSFTIEVRPSDGRLALVLGPGGTEVWSIAIGEHRVPPAIEAAERAKRDGDLDGALSLAMGAATATATAASAEVRGRALGVWGRILLARGQYVEAEAKLDRAAAEGAAAGLLSEPVHDRLAQAFLAIIHLRRFEVAERALDEGERLAARGYPAGTAMVSYYRGLLARETGDVRSALKRFEDSVDRAERLGRHDLAAEWVQPWATLLVTLGRPEEAFSKLKLALDAAGPEARACDRALLLNNVAWARLVAREAELGELAANEELEAELDEAERLHRTECKWRAHLANVLLNRALARVQTGSVAAAQSALSEARTLLAEGEDTNWLLSWLLELQGRVALRERRPREALEIYQRLDRLAVSTLSSEARWRSSLGQARALLALGNRAAALESYQSSEQILDRESADVPLGQGRAGFLAGREAGAAELMTELLAGDRSSDAWSVARRASARALARFGGSSAIERLSDRDRAAWRTAIASFRAAKADYDRLAANDWKLSAAALARASDTRAMVRKELEAKRDEALRILERLGSGPLPELKAEPNEVILGFYPSTSRGGIGFAIEPDGRIRSAALPARSAAALATDPWLAPFADLLAEARRVRAVVDPRLESFELQRAAYLGRPLIAHMAVTHALDAGSPPARLEAGGKRALMVFDPSSDLPQARREGPALTALLQERGFEVAVLSGIDARSTAVRAALERSDLFHYAGHGESLGFDGIDSLLPLATGESFSAAEVLTLGSAPELVFLSACDAARSRAGTGGALGMAQAFVLAGARGVVAATRPVDDRHAAQLAELFYRSSAGDPAERLREAQLELDRRGVPEEEWAAFRLLVP